MSLLCVGTEKRYLFQFQIFELLCFPAEPTLQPASIYFINNAYTAYSLGLA